MPSQVTTTSQQSNLIKFDSAANAIGPDKIPTPEEVLRLKLAVEKLPPDQKDWLRGKIADTSIEDASPESFDLEDELVIDKTDAQKPDLDSDNIANNSTVEQNPIVEAASETKSDIVELRNIVRDYLELIGQTNYASSIAGDVATKRSVEENRVKLVDKRIQILAIFRQALTDGVNDLEIESVIKDAGGDKSNTSEIARDMIDFWEHSKFKQHLLQHLEQNPLVRKEPVNKSENKTKIEVELPILKSDYSEPVKTLAKNQLTRGNTESIVENDDNFTINPPLAEEPNASIEPAKPVDEIASLVEMIPEKVTEPAPVASEPVATAVPATESVIEPKQQEPEISPQAMIEKVVEPEPEKDQSPILNWLEVVNTGKEGGLTAASVAGKGPGAVEPQGQEDRK
ncbi:hypothetical protein COT78_03020 [Candidatus Berkelbacteria bacterium CG10_big_fil_rev_8_21_14_0_10_43_13]|uniref:Uncharacterized protein n=1 Tax=Candidatus Berkelbacteria bacterium CG10_big_fil_rev_8_21_14_0_10_43_13 TaxID=1974514 RepID=A0A2H0W6C2_9BACT|nr:MAG: hypothetical protein COT78_03020 [Candidatus Berkelbacteria bacterium CG10_big_fil_rev_8_21_14_0_10_43_13]